MAVAERPDVDEAEDTRERVTVWDTGEVLYVHPVASLFPMMSDEELDDLAEDIRQNGQADPIVLDQHGQLIDGRNRLEACRRAQTAPDFVTVALDDPIAFILSKNVARRQMDKGQIAMTVVRAKVFATKTFARQGRETARQLGVSGPRLSYAWTVLREAPELCEEVISGALTLDRAYAAATQSKSTRKAAEDEARQREADMAQLREGAPDLAQQVEDHRLEIKQALAQLTRRREEEQERRQTRTRVFLQALAVLDPGRLTWEERARELHTGLDQALLLQSGGMGDLGLERLRGCRAVLEGLIGLREADRGETR